MQHGKYLSKEFLNELESEEKGLESVFAKCVAEQEQKQDQEQDNNIMSGSPVDKKSFRSDAIEVLQFLNEKTGRAYRPVDTNLKLIVARLKSGATVSECYQVIAKKTREWKNHPEMDQYLRPATLFNATKFEQYVGELVVVKDREVSA